MATEEREPLMVPGQPTESAVPLFYPPPAYDRSETTKDSSKDIPLPTYDQSEKYEKEGVLEYTSDEVIMMGSTTDGISEQGSEEELPLYNRGTLCEFMVFFIVCALFSVFGFVFAFCVAWTVAAQTGALAGLGLAFLSKPILFELQPEYMTSLLKDNYCYSYADTEQYEPCMQRGHTIVRLFLWLLGLFGLYLLVKGTSTYIKVRCNTRRS
eukprot:Em0022g292a